LTYETRFGSLTSSEWGVSRNGVVVITASGPGTATLSGVGETFGTRPTPC